MGIRQKAGWVGSGLLASSLALIVGSTPARAQPKDCAVRPAPFDDHGLPWGPAPLSKLKRDTQYQVVAQDGRQVPQAQAETSASLYGAAFKPARSASGWRGSSWKTDALVPRADKSDRPREDAPPGSVVTLAVMPDPDNTGEKATGLCAGFAFDCAPK